MGDLSTLLQQANGLPLLNLGVGGIFVILVLDRIKGIIGYAVAKRNGRNSKQELDGGWCAGLKAQTRKIDAMATTIEGWKEYVFPEIKDGIGEMNASLRKQNVLLQTMCTRLETLQEQVNKKAD